MDNTYNNNTAVNNFIIKFRFNSKEYYIWCVIYIFNLVTQSCLFSKDKNLFKNE